MKLGECRAESCKAPVLWCVTINGRPQPFDPEPDPAGDFILVKRDDDAPLALSVSRLGLHGDEITGPVAGAATYTAHHATCPARKDFAK